MILTKEGEPMKLAKKITIDRENKRVLIDGKQVAYYLHVDGPLVTNVMVEHDIPVVHLPILAEDVEIIPASGDE